MGDTRAGGVRQDADERIRLGPPFAKSGVMEQVITGRWSGKRGNGRACTVTEVTQYDRPRVTAAPSSGSYVLVDHEPTERLAKGRYQILPGHEVVTCDDPDAP